MKVRGLDGQTHSWSLGDYVGKQNMNSSSLHDRARNFLREIFPATSVLEEVYIPGERLFLDFYIPAFKLSVECQGTQHAEHVIFFHKTRMDFLQAKTRDRRKAEWCELNDIKLIKFYPEETDEEWKKKL